MTLEFGPKSSENLQTTALKLIDLIYEAAVDPVHWDEFLRVYSELYPGASQWLWLEDRQRAETGEHELGLLRLLIPHMQRAARLYGHYLGLEDRTAGSEAALDQLSTGAVLCDAEGRVLFTNQAAETIVKSRDGLALERGRLIALARAANRSLSAMIGDALREPPVPAVSEGALLVSRPSGDAPYAIAVAPLPRRARIEKGFIEPGQGAPRLLVTIAETQARAPAPGRLRSLFGLTPGEARLVEALVQAESLAVAADTVGITEGTARQVLKRVFLKTDTRSQAGLIKLVLSLQGYGAFCGKACIDGRKRVQP